MDLNNNKITETFYETGNFEVYCLCLIVKFDKDKCDLNALNKVNIYSKYFFVGGFDRDKKQGLIKLYRINYNNYKFEKTEIEFIQNITFKRFKGPITCITQSKINGNIFITCLDGNIYLFSCPNF